ncbi:MAG: DUF5050 domain-containing protein [Bacillota bacterium]|nr:DUF5050 domain-containing protein [Bacillota bacterium]
MNYGNEEDPKITDESEGNNLNETSKKHSIKRAVIISCICLLVIAAAIFFSKVLFFSSAENGLCNNYNSSIGSIKGDYLYHSSVDSIAFYKTNIKTGKSELISKESVSFFTTYKGNVYYFNNTTSKYLKYNEGAKPTEISSGLCYYPQIVGNYVYYLTPKSKYGGVVYRSPLDGSKTTETVLDVICSSFYVKGKDLYYMDMDLGALVKVPLKTALATCAKPKKDGTNRISSDLKAIVVFEGYAANINITNDKIYYLDANKSNKIVVYDPLSDTSKDFNFGINARYLNVSGDYLYYVNTSDKHLYRTKLDGSDITDLTGSAYANVAGICITQGKQVYFALVEIVDKDLNKNYKSVIVVADKKGKTINEISTPESENSNYAPSQGGSKAGASTGSSANAGASASSTNTGASTGSSANTGASASSTNTGASAGSSANAGTSGNKSANTGIEEKSDFSDD